MERKRRNRLVGGLFALGSTLLGTGAAEKPFTAVWPSLVPPDVWTVLPIAGVVTLGLSALAWFLIRIRVPSIMPDYECYDARESELASIHAIAIESLGEGVSPLEKMVQWYRRNPKIFTIVCKVSRNRSRKSRSIVGYYCVVPITEAAVELLKARELAGSSFLSEHIVKATDAPAAIYLGGIVANGLLARANTLSVLNRDLRGSWAKVTKQVFTTPTTNAGLRLVRKYGFTPVHASEAGKLNTLHWRSTSE